MAAAPVKSAAVTPFDPLGSIVLFKDAFQPLHAHDLGTEPPSPITELAVGRHHRDLPRRRVMLDELDNPIVGRIATTSIRAKHLDGCAHPFRYPRREAAIEDHNETNPRTFRVNAELIDEPADRTVTVSPPAVRRATYEVHAIDNDPVHAVSVPRSLWGCQPAIHGTPQNAMTFGEQGLGSHRPLR